MSFPVPPRGSTPPVNELEYIAQDREAGDRLLVVMPGKTWEITRAPDDWPTTFSSKGKAIIIDWTKVVAILWEV